MAFIFDEVQVNDGQFFVAENGKNPKSLGEGEKKVKHSAYIEGPLQVGNDGDFTSADGTVMIGKDGNTNATVALFVKGDVTIQTNGSMKGDINASGTVTATNFVGAHISGSISGGVSGKSAGAKAFDIEHPSKSGHRLRHICLEGPESAIYYRGRLKNEKVIRLPYYWKDLVNIDTISVQLQPIGVHQDIIVKRWDDEYVYLQAQGALPINCFFHVYAERKDVEKLIPEYEGTSVDDYPGDNSVYSINK
tara:strand:- start:59 stop:805 length:747 start_codon:yes stop_codon:yes gene_type:complete